MTTPLRFIIPGGDGLVGSIFSRHFHAQGNEVNVRKIALRSAMVMSPDHGGIFEMLLRLVRFGLGGAAGNGQQFISWIHDTDFQSALEFLITHEEFEGCVKFSSPHPLPNRDMRALRQNRALALRAPCHKQDAVSRLRFPTYRNRTGAKKPPTHSPASSRGWFSIPSPLLA